jgi:hypothetical protein
MGEEMSKLDIVVGYLNASTGPNLSSLQLAIALQAGSLDVLSDSSSAAAAVAYLFMETEPRLIALCAYEAGTNIKQANRLYENLLTHSMPRVFEWEESVQFFL